MKKLLSIVLIVAVAAGLVFVKRHDGTMQQSTTMNMPSGSSGAAAPEAVKTDTVAISNFKFSPAVITVSKGTTVTWTNKDSIAHTVTADKGTGPGSASLRSNETYRFTYTHAGNFPYHCDIHEDMKGMVIVTD